MQFLFIMADHLTLAKVVLLALCKSEGSKGLREEEIQPLSLSLNPRAGRVQTPAGKTER